VFDNNTFYYKNISSFNQYWVWLENVALPAIYNYDLESNVTHGYKIGHSRLRQIRSKPAAQCLAAGKLEAMNAAYILPSECYGNPNWIKDTNSYNTGWLPGLGNSSAWIYNESDTIDYVGHMGTYDGGGYVVELTQNYSDSLKLTDFLFHQNWFDRATRGLFLEVTEYIVGSPIFTTTTLLVEFPVTGGALPSYTVHSVQLLSFTLGLSMYMFLEILLLVITIYFIISTIVSIKAQKWSHFHHFWNIMELAVILLSVTNLGMYIALVHKSRDTYSKYMNNREGFTSFREVAHIYNTWNQINAFLLFTLCYVVSNRDALYKICKVLYVCRY
jgi:hypothetical protein